MRKYTLLLSVIAHLAVAAAVLVAPLFAAEKLPAVHDARPEWIGVKPVVLPDMPRRITRPAAPQPTPDSPVVAAFPTDAPKAIRPEAETPPLWSDGLGVGPVPDAFPDGGDGDRVAAPPPPVRAPEPRAPVRVGTLEQPRKLVHVAPIYPPLAVASRTSGVVILEAVIAEDGSVREVKVLRSRPLLDQAAIDAVRQWRFTPTKLNGEPVPVVMTVTVGFVLQ